MSKKIWFCAVAAFFYSCGNVENSADDAIVGVYTREYSREILNQSSGNKLGMRTVRDTLFIEKANDGYKIKNFKWQMNDYDNLGWQNMEHGDAGPMPVFEAMYDKQTKTLNPNSAGVIPLLHVKEGGKISVGDKSEIAFAKID